ncbi:hypothetical protein DAX92_25250 [Salmonella enterica subsp. enterica]|uniref:Uncharacterized protein n=1 Tax=Salmonella enterica I TaxID=59201 RepID=A0A7Z1PZS8_SALET|nr:hypothetical protein [Salmonella enterica]ECC3883412.1 hypothetical protein [Salmonella enterica subsp. diarizonae]PUF27695.1 hypothetical protein DAX92_25250 [Salmonella enterica subsp. enterica]EAR6896378.1 hypothetical protein [Salmonella enterica]ECJ4780205.1 hypothetical protein [Salmonella enterica subsp. diarizonae]
MLSSCVSGLALTDSGTILCRTEDAAAAFITDVPRIQPTSVRGGGSITTIISMMRAYRVRPREQPREKTFPLPSALQQLLIGQMAPL